MTPQVGMVVQWLGTKNEYFAKCLTPGNHYRIYKLVEGYPRQIRITTDLTNLDQVVAIDEVLILGQEQYDYRMNVPTKENTDKESLHVKFKLLHPDAKMPSYAKPGDAGLDVTAIDDGELTHFQGQRNYIEYGTGLAVEIPDGYVGLVYPRSSISNTSLSLSNAVGVIDSGYRGEIRFRFRVLNHANPRIYLKGDRIGQLVIVPYPRITPVLSEELSSTERGNSGYGSSG